LTNLQTLGLRNVLQHLLDDHHQQQQQQQQAQAYSGLTASSALQQLDLSACRFPPNSGAAVLHGGCCLPRLQRLVLYRCEDPPGSVLQVPDLDRLVDCCPVLEDLALWLSLSSNGSSGGGSSGSNGDSSSFQAAGQPQLQPLVGLSALARLVVAGPGVTCGELGAVGQLQGLQSLAMYRCSPLADASLLQLTQLTRLTTLAIDAHSCVTKWLGVTEYLFLQGPAGSRAAPSAAAAAGAQPSGASTPLSSSPIDGSKGIARVRQRGRWGGPPDLKYLCALGLYCQVNGRSAFLAVQACSTLASSCLWGAQDCAGHSSHVLSNKPRAALLLLLLLLLLSLQAIMAVRRELPIWQQLRRLLLTGSLLGDA
jgi:hypothetical protein